MIRFAKFAASAAVLVACSALASDGVAKPFEKYQVILQAAVKDRSVAYDVVEIHRAALDETVANIASSSVESLTKEQRLAFYTNAYNALVLAEVLKQKRPASVLKVDGFFDKIVHVVAKESLTLNALEEKKIRAAGDPRVHFVVNCASVDCPPLASQAYRASTWNADLDAQTKRYLSRPGEVVIDAAKKTITVTQLLEWYRGDFGGDDGVRKFLATHLPADARIFLDATFALTYRPYDWALNDVPRAAKGSTK